MVCVCVYKCCVCGCKWCVCEDVNGVYVYKSCVCGCKWCVCEDVNGDLTLDLRLFPHKLRRWWWRRRGLCVCGCECVLVSELRLHCPGGPPANLISSAPPSSANRREQIHCLILIHSLL